MTGPSRHIRTLADLDAAGGAAAALANRIRGQLGWKPKTKPATKQAKKPEAEKPAPSGQLADAAPTKPAKKAAKKAAPAETKAAPQTLTFLDPGLRTTPSS